MIINKINSLSVSRFDGREFFYMSLNFKDFISDKFMKRVERRYEMSFALFCDAKSCIISFLRVGTLEIAISI